MQSQRAENLTLMHAVAGSLSPEKRLHPKRGTKERGKGCQRTVKILLQVWKGSEVRHLGYFEDEVAADVSAYDRAVLELRGPGASTNFSAEDYGAPAATAHHAPPSRAHAHARPPPAAGGRGASPPAARMPPPEGSLIRQDGADDGAAALKTMGRTRTRCSWA